MHKITLYLNIFSPYIQPSAKHDGKCKTYFELLDWNMLFKNENIKLSQKVSVSSQFDMMQSCLNEKSDTMVFTQN